MIRRTTFVALATASLVLAPTTAMAYDAPGYGSTASDLTPASGSPTAIMVTGIPANAAVTLAITSNPPTISGDDIQIAGTKTKVNTANADGVATFTVTLSAAGIYALEASTGSPLVVVSTQTLTVAGAAGATASDLPATGFGRVGLAAGACALILVGAGTVLTVKRRRLGRATA